MMNALQHLGTLALIVASPLAILLYVALGPLVHRSPEVPADVSHLDARDGLGRCAHLLCDLPAQVHVHAGHDWYRFCLTHGLPYLRDGLGEQEVAG